ncbi:putative bifunctional diguanylate cyclase/phosphodiesterase [Brevibacillus dissolubilis]|uniref:putative bifunctional diguanylate cyclase/phosphodiesterase n=1 Tax=Brevibacillus dissolubilis TaxID=1844116 RepID=UPI001116239A|nr:EAL domain-containing protein [Brevibacillus dissolubilis]
MDVLRWRKYAGWYISVYIGCYYAWLFLFRESSNSTIQLASEFFPVAGPIVTVLLLYLAFRRVEEEGRYFWLFAAIGATGYCIGETITSYYQYVWNQDPPFPGVADIFYLFNALGLLLAILFKMYENKNHFKSLRLFFDVMVTMIVVTTLSWQFVIQPIIQQTEVPLLTIIVSAAYPVADLVFIFIMMVLYFSKNVLPPRLLSCISTGLFLIIVADVNFMIASANESEYTIWLEPLWTLGMMFLGLATLYDEFDTLKPMNRRQQVQVASLDMFRLSVPYISMTVLLIIMVMRHQQLDTIIIGATLSIVLVVARQIITIMENNNLLQRLHTFTERLELLVKQRTEELSVKNEELAVALGKMENMAFYDSLSGLPNRRYFEDRLKVALDQAHEREQMVAILFLDIDRFKFINDTLGHMLGDYLLVAVGQRIKGCMRDSDIVARQGGDEFTLMMEGIHSQEEVITVTRRIQQALSEPFMIEEHDLRITCSIGIAMYPGDGEDPETLMKNADTAMYRVKDEGKNGFEFYTDDMNQALSRKMVLERELHKAIERDEFLIYYQPQIDIQSDRIIGVEALIRWRHPTLGLIPPGEFISLAEETGLIIPIGEWILRTGCRQLKQWQDSGLPHIRLGVNISPRQFYQGNLVELVADVLEEVGLEPKYLDLEITENIAMQNVDIVIDLLQELKNLGVTISMDDFGTGYSSLYYLKRFPIDTLKIAQQFVRDITTDQNDRAIVSAIIAMAYKLNLNVIAEGVEESSQLEFLKSQKCQEVQGYFFSRPVPVHELEDILLQLQ